MGESSALSEILLEKKAFVSLKEGSEALWWSLVQGGTLCPLVILGRSGLPETGAPPALGLAGTSHFTEFKGSWWVGDLQYPPTTTTHTPTAEEDTQVISGLCGCLDHQLI